jgi:spore coat polysaccharide biosynthesis predicted glycosyltransferase SpsG
LRGPVYALLGSEYSELRETMLVRNGNVKNILVLLGGNDSTNETGKVVDAIRELRAQEELAVTVLSDKIILALKNSTTEQRGVQT